MSSDGQGLMLGGLDGGNPLGFLAAVGILQIASDSASNSTDVRLGWETTQEGWRPLLVGFGRQDELADLLLAALKTGSAAPFDIGRVSEGSKETNKFPFHASRFADALTSAVASARAEGRRNVDLLASLGTEMHPNKKNGDFQCTSFKMVRSGDSNSQGMLFYAKAMREGVDCQMIKRSLFEAWDYQDEGYSLRLDPIEDRRYALRWRDPSKSNLTDGPGTMTAANCLAVEALRCFPVMPTGPWAHTTGFRQERDRTLFVWPIWRPSLAIQTVRSLLSFAGWHERPLDRSVLAARGIEEVYGSELVRPNQYYSSFLPALPIT